MLPGELCKHHSKSNLWAICGFLSLGGEARAASLDLSKRAGAGPGARSICAHQQMPFSELRIPASYLNKHTDVLPTRPGLQGAHMFRSMSQVTERPGLNMCRGLEIGKERQCLRPCLESKRACVGRKPWELPHQDTQGGWWRRPTLQGFGQQGEYMAPPVDA